MTAIATIATATISDIPIAKITTTTMPKYQYCDYYYYNYYYYLYYYGHCNHNYYYYYYYYTTTTSITTPNGTTTDTATAIALLRLLHLSTGAPLRDESNGNKPYILALGHHIETKTKGTNRDS